MPVVLQLTNEPAPTFNVQSALFSQMTNAPAPSVPSHVLATSQFKNDEAPRFSEHVPPHTTLLCRPPSIEHVLSQPMRSPSPIEMRQVLLSEHAFTIDASTPLNVHVPPTVLHVNVAGVSLTAVHVPEQLQPASVQPQLPD